MPVLSLLRGLQLYRLPFPPFVGGLFLNTWSHGGGVYSRLKRRYALLYSYYH